MKRHNLLKRGNVWYFKKVITLDGVPRVYRQTLRTGNFSVACDRARILRDTIEDKRFEQLDKAKVRHNLSKMDDVYGAYMRLIKNYERPSANTALTNIRCMNIILRTAGFPEPEVVSTHCLTGAVVMKYAEEMFARNNDRARTMRTIRSTLRQGRSIFSRRMRRLYRSEAVLKLPDLDDFLSTIPCDNPQAKREEYTKAELAILRSGKELKGRRNDLYMVWLLGYHLALRASEMASARWSWISQNAKGDWEMEICHRPEEGFNPKGYSGWVPMTQEVYNELRSLARPGDPYLLPGSTCSQRHELVTREFARWMRKQGWTRRHSSHELRAYRGNVWRHELGLEVMRDWMRHSQIAVGVNHYTTRHNMSHRPTEVEEEE